MFVKLLALFLIVPIIELYVMLQIGKVIGLGITILIIFITAFIGAKLTKAQGLQAIKNGRSAFMSGKLPHKEVIDGVLIIIAGAVLLTPGFLTDLLGFSLLVPTLRSSYRELLINYFKSRIVIHRRGQNNDKKSKPDETEDQTILEAEIIDD